MSESINPEPTEAEDDVDVVAHGLGEEEAIDDSVCIINNSSAL
ncbi:hypothetical protein [Kitasatospora sp. NPDC093806]